MSPDVLLDDEDLAITWLPGRGARLVVSFTGIGHRKTGFAETETVQQIEFPKIASQEGDNHVAFVTDRTRTWYNTPGQIERIETALRALAARVGARQIVTLGNSMGAYGAILFANRIGAARAIAFAPQFTMDDRLVRDRRWQDLKRHIPRHAVPSLAGAMVGPCRFFVLHGGRGEDGRHWRRFPTGPNIQHYVLPLKTHAVAVQLRHAGKLPGLIDALFAEDTETVIRSMSAENGYLRGGSGWPAALHGWAASQSTRLGHRSARWLVEQVVGPAPVST
ncbi:MAG: hypothetical protein AAFR17_02350 [Pseudomonadota bacterium]